MNLAGLFTNVAPGTYEVEIETRVNSGTGKVLNDTNGPGTRFLKAIVRPQ